ncbi:MAG: bifunctional methionine sulfoxide reductase B/A protein [Burkholderiales bacterium]|nr:bifunctional methionine sulfoxide reductase B/A protein [Burkholderiales bacterium]
MLKTASLTPDARKIIVERATEYSGSGEYNDFDQAGTYLCRQCGIALFRAEHKFHSGCGWPSFDLEISGRVKREPDADGRRIEILCNRCHAHLGHVFHGEGFTPLNTRHCVNSLALDFVANTQIEDSEEVILAAGCFWGVEYYLQQLPGVVKTQVGYSGGHTLYPSYKDVCSGSSGHLEVIRVVFDPRIINYEGLIKYFFEIHDPTQTNGQGPDIGDQYLSAIFCYTELQQQIASQLIATLKHKGYAIATKIRQVSTFWLAEDYHQHYYMVNQKLPYCHSYVKKF